MITNAQKFWIQAETKKRFFYSGVSVGEDCVGAVAKAGDGDEGGLGEFGVVPVLGIVELWGGTTFLWYSLAARHNATAMIASANVHWKLAFMRTETDISWVKVCGTSALIDPINGISMPNAIFGIIVMNPNPIRKRITEYSGFRYPNPSSFWA